MHGYPQKNWGGFKKVDTRIYIMSHKNFEVPFEKGYLPLQVGSEGSIDLGYQQISEEF